MVLFEQIHLFSEYFSGPPQNQETRPEDVLSNLIEEMNILIQYRDLLMAIREILSQVRNDEEVEEVHTDEENG